MKPLSDIAAERSILAGVCQYGHNCYLDIADIIQSKTFTVDYNQLIFSCIKYLYENTDITQLDVSVICSAGETLGLSNIMSRRQFLEHLESLFNYPILQENVRKMAAQVRKLEIARLLREQLRNAGDKLLELDGNESISHILGIAENSIFDFSSLLNDYDQEPKKLTDGLLEHLEELVSNPIDQIGLPTGFPEYDKIIGGGLRNGTINVIGARTGMGKSQLGGAIGFHIADQHNIPVLVMDTEMTFEDHLYRILGMGSDTFIYEIETGKFDANPMTQQRVKEFANKIVSKNLPYEHKSIAGMPFEEQLAIMRRWLVKNVGLDSDGNAKPCLIVYDYLKLMNADNITKNLAEYQALGFMMSSLHNFTIRYKIPILAFVQLNRDGIDKETTGATSGSDRIVWLCSNLAIFKEKSAEEIAQDGESNGTHKLVVLKSRHGPGNKPGDYINCYMQGAKAKIVEGKTKFQLKNEKDNEQTE